MRKAGRRAKDANEVDRDAALHHVRKKVKRLRYAAESSRSALGTGAASLARQAKRAQSALGEHQDTVVARAAPRRWALDAELQGSSAFTYDRLHAFEEQMGRTTMEGVFPILTHLHPKNVRKLLRR